MPNIRVAAGSAANTIDPILIKMDATEWMSRGACVGKDPEWWTTADNGRRAQPKPGDLDPTLSDEAKGNLKALAWCSVCPVRVECLQYALSTKATREHGIWGGTYPHQRENLKWWDA